MSDTVSWIDLQKRQLAAGLRAIREKKALTITQPFFRIDHPISDLTVLYANDLKYREGDNFSADIFFCQGYSDDLERLRFLRRSGKALILASWFWDNHHLFGETSRAASLSDVYFYAHNFKTSYIENEISLDGGFVPLCPIFWELCEVETAARQSLLAPRSDQIYGGYNSYLEFPERDLLLERVRALLPDNQLFLTPHGTPAESHPFYRMSAVDKLLEWMRFKSSLCLSFGGNMAIRIYDMLLGGGIPLIVGRPHDLDATFSRRLQEELPIVVVEDEAPQSIAAAHQLCLSRFDADGVDGIMRRHAFIKDNHMPHHRLSKLVDTIRSMADNPSSLKHLSS